MAARPSGRDQTHSPAGICCRVTNTHKCQARVTATHLHILQMGRALDFLKVQRFMHSDIKLENVMLVNHQKEPFRVKLIDFGLADKVSRVEMGQTIQTLPYRWTLVSRRNVTAGGERGRCPHVSVLPQVSRGFPGPPFDRGHRYVVSGVSGCGPALGESTLPRQM